MNNFVQRPFTNAVSNRFRHIKPKNSSSIREINGSDHVRYTEIALRASADDKDTNTSSKYNSN